MIEEPLRYLDAFRRAGGDTLVFHIESRSDAKAVVKEAHRLGAAVGGAIRPDTPLAALDPVFDDLDQVLVMSVHPGFSGQKFIPDVLPKVRDAHRRIQANGRGAYISMDGGLTAETAVAAAEAGTSFFVCGNSVFNATGTVAENLARLRAAVTEGAGHGVS
jgi:ribulose-phosphate 3-epimerase